jgi:hypothetical protein
MQTVLRVVLAAVAVTTQAQAAQAHLVKEMLAVQVTPE